MSQHHKSTRADREAKAAFKERCKHEPQPDGTTGAPCWICRMPIDYDAPFDDWKNPDRFERDHYYAAADFPQLYDDPANWRASHAGCNNAKSNGAPPVDLGSTSRDWSKV